VLFIPKGSLLEQAEEETNGELVEMEVVVW